MIGAADDVADAHIHIVGDHAQVIGRNAIGAEQHEVFEFSIGKLHATEDSVVESGITSFRHSEAQSRGFPRCAPPGAFLARNLSAGTVVAWGTALGGSHRAALLQLWLGAKTIVSMSGSQQPGRALAIHFHALGLLVGALVPIEAKPAHALQNAFHYLSRRALDVGILNAQDERAAVMAGEQPVE